MKRFFYCLFIFLYLVVASSAFAQNTHLSDYQFQLDQYRSSYAEYQNFRSDYLAHPTLNNEQKAIQAAKQTIAARELAWANYILVLSDTISDTKVDYPLTNKSIADLDTIAKYHFAQAAASVNIVTRGDLTNFTKNELLVISNHKLALAQAQVASKIAQLIKLQTEASIAYNLILPKLESLRDEVNVQSGLDQIQDYGVRINTGITTLADKTAKLDIQQSSQNQFLSDSTEALIQIRTNLNRLVSVIIDLDSNYVHR